MTCDVPVASENAHFGSTQVKCIGSGFRQLKSGESRATERLSQ